MWSLALSTISSRPVRAAFTATRASRSAYSSSGRAHSFFWAWAKASSRREKAEALRADYQSKADAEAKAAAQSGQEAAQRQAERLESAAQMEAKKQMLAAKQACLDEAFAQAQKKLCALPDEEYADLLD